MTLPNDLLSKFEADGITSSSQCLNLQNALPHIPGKIKDVGAQQGVRAHKRIACVSVNFPRMSLRGDILD